MVHGIIIIVLFLMSLSSVKGQTVAYYFNVEKASMSIESMLYLSLLSIEDFCLGTPFQCQKVQFDPGASLTLILNKQSQFVPNEGLYNKSLSSTYGIRPRNSEEFSGQKMMRGICSIESIKFGPFESAEGYFFLGNNWISELHHSSIGLSTHLKDQSYHYFVRELYDAKVINAPQYTIVFDDSLTGGRIIFGDDQSLEQSLSLRKAFEVSSELYFIVDYFSIKRLTINSTIETPGKCSFDEAFGFVQMPSRMNEVIKKEVIRDSPCRSGTYKPTRRDNIRTSYLYYLCPKRSINIDLYEDVVFELMTGQVVLRKEDLFLDYDDDTVILSIVIRVDAEDPQWTIGFPILKHYALRRKFNRNTLVFYTKVIQPPLKGTKAFLVSAISILSCGLIILALIHIRTLQKM